jgi:hypothetical protein
MYHGAPTPQVFQLAYIILPNLANYHHHGDGYRRREAATILGLFGSAPGTTRLYLRAERAYARGSLNKRPLCCPQGLGIAVGGGAAVCYPRRNRRPVVILGSRRGCETLAQDVREIITVFGARLCDGRSRRPQVARLLRA